MRQLYIYPVVVLLLGALFATPVQAAKLKHQSTLYSDNAEQALKFPEGVACNSDSLIVADTGNSRIVRYQLGAQKITAEAVLPLPDTSPLITQLGSNGDIYVLDGKSRQILVLDRDGQSKGKIEPKGMPEAKTVVPRSFRLVGNELYLLDIFAERLLVLDLQGNYQRHLPFPDGYRFFSDFAVSQQGTIYLLDSVAGAIYQAASGAEAFSPFSSGLKEYLNFPTSLETDKNGELFLSDQYGSGLVVIGRDGGFQGRKFGMGWEDGQFYYPSQLCINGQNNLVIADRSNSRVQVFSILEE